MSTGTASSVESSERNYVVPKHGAGRLTPWKKGQTGNPNGIYGGNSEYHKVRKLCADHCVEATLRLIEAMRTTDDPRVLTVIWKEMCDRGIGPAKDHTEEARTIVNLDNLTDDERALLATLMGKALPKDGA